MPEFPQVSRGKKMKPALTDRQVRTMSAARARKEISDGGCRGLSIRCTPTGIKTWSYAYKLDGKMRRITLGGYPAMGLAKARSEADELRNQRIKGKDPRAAQQAERAQRAQLALTVNSMCDSYVVHLKARGKLSWKADERYLKPTRAKLGKRPVASITKRDLTDILQTAAKRSKVAANRMQSTLRTMWGWAADRDDVAMNFLAGMKKVGGKEKSKDRVLTTDELRAFFAALAEATTRATPIVRLALRCILLTAQRPSEVSGMMLSELHGLDQSDPHWIIPRLRTKNKKAEHTVPLSPAAVLLIKEGLEASRGGWQGKNDRPVFAGRFEGLKNLARHSLSHAVRRIIKDKKFAKFTPHDLRRTGATLAQSLRIPRDYVKALLNHADGDVTATYARWHMFEEKREAVIAIEKAVLPLMPEAVEYGLR
jgi:integrase